MSADISGEFNATSIMDEEAHRDFDDIRACFRNLDKKLDTLLCARNNLARFSPMELETIFSNLPGELCTLDISNNLLCTDNRAQSEYLLQLQENKLWSVCKHAKHVKNLNIANNELQKLPKTAYQRFRAEMNQTLKITVSLREITTMTMAQIQSFIEMFPNLESIVFVDSCNKPVAKNDEDNNALVCHAKNCMPNNTTLHTISRTRSTSCS